MYNNPLPRRGFLRGLGRLAVGSVALAALENGHAAQETGYMEYGGLRCYVARPSQAAGKTPVVLLIHGERGLDSHIEDLARRTGLAGFAAVAPDLLFPSGGTPKEERRAREMIAALDGGQTLANLLAIVDDLAARPETGKLGCVGFHWGGGMANQLAVHSPAIVAASAFYGAVPDAVDVPRIQARLLLHYAARDELINTRVPAFEGALKAAGVQHAIHVYADTGHAAAELAWTRTLTFLKEALL